MIRAWLGICLALGSACAATSDVIRVWRIGSPHHGDTPKYAIRPAALFGDATPHFESYPARDLAPRLKMLDSGSVPDLLVLDNYGLINGITTELGRFDGIAQDVQIREQLVQVKGSFDALLGPRGGATFLLSKSPNFAIARESALRTPGCEERAPAKLSAEMDELVSASARAYMTGDAKVLDRVADPARMADFYPPADPARVHEVRACDIWGDERLTVVSTTVSYEAASSLGHTPVLLVFRKPASRWQLLVASRDLISNGRFLKALSGFRTAVVERRPAANATLPVVLRSADGVFPQPVEGSPFNFGDFEWDAQWSDDVITDIAEFTYRNDARLIVVPRSRTGPSGVNASQLWTTHSEWKWRVWSLTRSGDLVFSESRTFRH